MRNEFAHAVVEMGKINKSLIFLTGDLGFHALEEVRDTLKDRFINAGVAEQNMVSVAAGLASKGLRPIVYSITPFILMRAFEQIRNDICFHNMPVILAGNGGGYGYGIMGSSHHALQDIGLMRMLPNIKTIVPTFASDVMPALKLAMDSDTPSYLRLNSAPKSDFPFYPWRKLIQGNRSVVIGTGPVVLNALKENTEQFSNSFSVWALSVFPSPELPSELLKEIRELKRLVVIEEHVQPGGLGEFIAYELLLGGITDLKIIFLNAKGYPSGRYGSQTWHQNENGLAGEGLRFSLAQILS